MVGQFIQQHFFSHGILMGFEMGKNSHHYSMGFWYLRDNYGKN